MDEIYESRLGSHGTASDSSFSDFSTRHSGSDISSGGSLPLFSPHEMQSGVESSSGSLGHEVSGPGFDSSISSSSMDYGSNSGMLDHNSNQTDLHGGQFDNASGRQSDDVDTSRASHTQENPTDPPYIRDLGDPPEDSGRSNRVNVLYSSDDGVPSGSSHDPTVPYSEVGSPAVRGGGDTGVQANATDRPEVQEMFNTPGIGPIYNPGITDHNPNIGDSGSSAQDFVNKVRDIVRPIDFVQKVESVPFDTVAHLSRVSEVAQDLYKNAHLLRHLGPVTLGLDLVASGVEYYDAMSDGDRDRAREAMKDAIVSLAGEALHLTYLPLGIAYDIYSAYNDLKEMSGSSHQK